MSNFFKVSSKSSYWKVECSRHLKILYQTKINAKHISEKKLVEFIRALISKYALSDDEILESYTQIPFKPKQEIVNVTRTNSKLDEPLRISFSAQVADISVTVWLTD